MRLLVAVLLLVTLLIVIGIHWYLLRRLVLDTTRRGASARKWATAAIAYFVTGNHEYHSGFEDWIAEVRSLGLRPLRNERVELDGLDLAGVNDATAGSAGDPPDYDRALAGRDTSRPVVLLAHQPIQAHEAARRGADLQISGPTHGGQMWPFSLVIAAQQPVVAGLGRVDGMPVYVSRGAGFWGPPVRVCAPPDITLIELRTR